VPKIIKAPKCTPMKDKFVDQSGAPRDKAKQERLGSFSWADGDRRRGKHVYAAASGNGINIKEKKKNVFSERRHLHFPVRIFFLPYKLSAVLVVTSY